MKNISILGASGSIGSQSIEILNNNRDKFTLDAISVGENIDYLRKILSLFTPKLVCVKNKNHFDILKSEYPNIRFTYGLEGLFEISTFPSTHTVINGLVGNIGLMPTIHAIENGKNIALANKETIVTAGHIINEKIKKHNVKLIPVDSEHSAIFQCLNGENKKDINKLILTASGGCFRDKTREEIKNVTVEEALKHPNWSMGAKITIDSTTMANKGLEVIEAHFLFDIPYENINVIIHKESIIHSMIEFKDTTIMAQMGMPDMKNPIQYALTYPDRIFNKDFSPLDFGKITSLNFSPVDFNRYPCVKMAFDAGKLGGSATTVFNSANEEAVKLFLERKIPFLSIETLIYETLNSHSVIKNPSLDEILNIDRETRNFVNNLYKTIKATH